MSASTDEFDAYVEKREKTPGEAAFDAYDEKGTSKADQPKALHSSPPPTGAPGYRPEDHPVEAYLRRAAGYPTMGLDKVAAGIGNLGAYETLSDKEKRSQAAEGTENGFEAFAHGFTDYGKHVDDLADANPKANIAGHVTGIGSGLAEGLVGGARKVLGEAPDLISRLARAGTTAARAAFPNAVFSHITEGNDPARMISNIAQDTGSGAGTGMLIHGTVEGLGSAKDTVSRYLGNLHSDALDKITESSRSETAPLLKRMMGGAANESSVGGDVESTGVRNSRRGGFVNDERNVIDEWVKNKGGMDALTPQERVKVEAFYEKNGGMRHGANKSMSDAEDLLNRGPRDTDIMSSEEIRSAAGSPASEAQSTPGKQPSKSTPPPYVPSKGMPSGEGGNVPIMEPIPKHQGQDWQPPQPEVGTVNQRGTMSDTGPMRGVPPPPQERVSQPGDAQYQPINPSNAGDRTQFLRPDSRAAYMEEMRNRDLVNEYARKNGMAELSPVDQTKSMGSSFIGGAYSGVKDAITSKSPIDRALGSVMGGAALTGHMSTAAAGLGAAALRGGVAGMSENFTPAYQSQLYQALVKTLNPTANSPTIARYLSRLSKPVSGLVGDKNNPNQP